MLVTWLQSFQRFCFSLSLNNKQKDLPLFRGKICTESAPWPFRQSAVNTTCVNIAFSIILLQSGGSSQWWWCWQRWRWQICFVQRSDFHRETKKLCEGWSAMALEVLRLEKKILSFTIGKSHYQQYHVFQHHHDILYYCRFCKWLLCQDQRLAKGRCCLRWIYHGKNWTAYTGSRTGRPPRPTTI